MMWTQARRGSCCSYAVMWSPGHILESLFLDTWAPHTQYYPQRPVRPLHKIPQQVTYPKDVD